MLEFARLGQQDLPLFAAAPFELGLGVIDVKDQAVESPSLVAERIGSAAGAIAPDRLWVNPDCGLRHLSTDVARAKLQAMVEGAALARAG